MVCLVDVDNPSKTFVIVETNSFLLLYTLSCQIVTRVGYKFVNFKG